MERTIQNIPFLRIALAFACGIVFQKHVQISQGVIVTAIIFLLFSIFLIHKKYRYKLEPAFGVAAFSLFLFFGAFTFLHYNKPPQFFAEATCIGTVLEKPQEKQNSYKSVVRLTAFQQNNIATPTNETILVYFAKTDRVKQIKPGMQLVINTRPQIIKNFGNPFEFDYKAYLNNKRIYRQLYLNDQHWNLTQNRTTSFRIKAELLREKLLTIYRSQNLGKNETEILSALTLGYKRNLERETKRIFSAAGAMHILAVSGLHVGIIFMVFNFLFGFLRKRKEGKYIFIVSSITLLWFYAFITGLSPSVLRATTMFSIVIIGTNINRKPNIYNSLAASAFFLLLINPNNLFEVGFQLSYSAVYGIVFLQPRIEELWKAPNKIVKFFWTLLTVSVSAQIATFPLSSFYFNQFPSYFWLSNIFIIPAVTVLIPLGILLLIFSNIPVLSTAIAFAVQGLIKAIYLLLQFIETLPLSTLDIAPAPHETILLILVFLSLLLFIHNGKVVNAKLSLFAILLMGISFLAATYTQRFHNQFIIYNNANNLTLHLISGRNNYVISQDTINNTDFLFQQIQNVKRKKRLQPPVMLYSSLSFEDDFLCIEKNHIRFKDKQIWIRDSKQKLPPSFAPDFIVSERDFNTNTEKTDEQTKVITIGNLPANTQSLNVHSLKHNGSFITEW